MPLLTLKTIQRTGDAGTTALDNAGKLFSRAFKDLTGAAKTVNTGIEKNYENASDETTQKLLNQINAYKDVDSLEGDRAGLQDSIFNSNLTSDDLAKVNTTLAERKKGINDEITANFNLEKLRTQQDESTQITSLKNTIALSQNPAEVAVAKAQLANLNSDISSVAGAADQRTATLQSDITRNQAFQDSQAVRNTDTSVITQGNDTGSIQQALADIDALVAQRPLNQRAAYRQTLLNDRGITPEKQVQSIFAGLPKTDANGEPINVDAALTAAVNKAFPNMRNSDEVVNKFIANKEAATGVDTVKAIAADERKRSLDLRDALLEQRQKVTPEAQNAEEAQKAINLFIDEDFVNLVGTSDREDAQKAIGPAIEAGVSLPIIKLLLQKHGRSSFSGNLNLGALEKDVNIAVAKAARDNLINSQ